MSKDEVIKIIEDACWWYWQGHCHGLTQAEIFEARDRAIQALEQMPEVTSTMQTGQFDYVPIRETKGISCSECKYFKVTQEPICDRDCEHCTWTECPIEPCDDAISREDAEQMFRNIRSHLKPQDYKSAEEFNTRDLMLLNAEQMIHALPSVTQKSGEWDSSCTCSVCGQWKILESEKNSGKYKFCPNCGANMESEDKE